jgi:hypothetical protein
MFSQYTVSTVREVGYYKLRNDIATCRMVRVTIVTGSSSDDWIYWHFGYKFS